MQSRPGRERKQVPAVPCAHPYADSDHLYFASNGGGGYGLPWDRKVEAVLDDVIDGLISLDKARDVYGVSITEVDADALVYDVDDDETNRLRAALAARDDRPRGLGPFEVHEAGERLFRLPAELHAGLTPPAD